MVKTKRKDLGSLYMWRFSFLGISFGMLVVLASTMSSVANSQIANHGGSASGSNLAGWTMTEECYEGGTSYYGGGTCNYVKTDFPKYSQIWVNQNRNPNTYLSAEAFYSGPSNWAGLQKMTYTGQVYPVGDPSFSLNGTEGVDITFQLYSGNGTIEGANLEYDTNPWNPHYGWVGYGTGHIYCNANGCSGGNVNWVRQISLFNQYIQYQIIIHPQSMTWDLYFGNYAAVRNIPFQQVTHADWGTPAPPTSMISAEATNIYVPANSGRTSSGYANYRNWKLSWK